MSILKKIATVKAEVNKAKAEKAVQDRKKGEVWNADKALLGWNYYKNVALQEFLNVGRVTVMGMTWKDVLSQLRALKTAREECDEDHDYVTSLAHTIRLYMGWFALFLGSGWEKKDGLVKFAAPFIVYQKPGEPEAVAICKDAIDKGIEEARKAFFMVVDEKDLADYSWEFTDEQEVALNNMYEFASMMERATRYEQEGIIDVVKTFDKPKIFLEDQMKIIKLNSRNANDEFALKANWDKKVLEEKFNGRETVWAAEYPGDHEKLQVRDVQHMARVRMLQAADDILSNKEIGMFSVEQSVPAALRDECIEKAMNVKGESFEYFVDQMIKMFQTLSEARREDVREAVKATNGRAEEIASVKRSVGAFVKEDYNAFHDMVVSYFRKQGIGTVDMVKIILGGTLLRQQEESGRPSSFANIILGDEFFLFLCDYFGKDEILAKDPLALVRGFEDGDKAEFISGAAVGKGKVAFVSKKQSLPDGEYVIRKDETGKWFATQDAVKAIRERCAEVNDDTLVFQTTGSVIGMRAKFGGIEALAKKLTFGKKVTLWNYDFTKKRDDVHNAVIVDNKIVTSYTATGKPSTTSKGKMKPDPRQNALYDFKEGIVKKVRPIRYIQNGKKMEALFIILEKVAPVEYDEALAQKTSVVVAQNATMLARKVVLADPFNKKARAKKAADSAPTSMSGILGRLHSSRGAARNVSQPTAGGLKSRLVKAADFSGFQDEPVQKAKTEQKVVVKPVKKQVSQPVHSLPRVIRSGQHFENAFPGFQD